MKRFVLLMLVLLSPLLTLSGTEAAPDLPRVVQQCLNQKVSLTVIWSGARSDGQIYLDLSTVDDSWAPGSFSSAGPFSGVSGNYQWPGLTPNINYFLRVNQRQPDDSWAGSPALAFKTMACNLSASALGSNAPLNSVYLFGAGSGKYDSIYAPPDDSMDICTPRYVDAFVRVSDASQLQSLRGRWFLNNKLVPNAGPDTAAPGFFILNIPGLNIQFNPGTGSANVTFTLDFGGTPVPPGNADIRVEIGTRNDPSMITGYVTLHC
jgi:hypothetical protein